MTDRVVAHIDFDSFFASCEQQFNPTLRGKPIGVTATNGRTCIIAASREAKRFGVKNVTRVWEAQKLCPQIIPVPAHFEKYWEITQKFLDICKDYSPYVELFSLDEVFIDFTSTEKLFGGRYKALETIKRRIRREIGEYITVSVGLSHNKLLAKLGSGMNKPNGFTEINKYEIEKVYSEVELTDFCGIGNRIEKRLNAMGIYTPLQLRATPLEALIAEFKEVEGKFLKSLGDGIDTREVIPYYLPTETKSVGRNYCLPRNEFDQRVILQTIFELCEEVGIKLRRLDKKAKSVGMYLGGANNWHGRKTVVNHISQGKDIFRVCKMLYDEWGLNTCSSCFENSCKGTCPERSRKMVRQVGIWTGNLEDASNLTMSLFETAEKPPKLLKAMDEINERFGSHTIRNGFLLNSSKLKTVPNGFMADRLERQKLVGSVGVN